MAAYMTPTRMTLTVTADNLGVAAHTHLDYLVFDAFVFAPTTGHGSYDSSTDVTLLSDVVAAFVAVVGKPATPSFAQACAANMPSMTYTEFQQNQYWLAMETYYPLDKSFPENGEGMSWAAISELHSLATLEATGYFDMKKGRALTREQWLAAFCGMVQGGDGFIEREIPTTSAATEAACLAFLTQYPDYFVNTMEFLAHDH